MRAEQNIRERLERLVREGEVQRQQIARLILSDKPEDWASARDLMGREKDNAAMIRALDFALGQRP